MFSLVVPARWDALRWSNLPVQLYQARWPTHTQQTHSHPHTMLGQQLAFTAHSLLALRGRRFLLAVKPSVGNKGGRCEAWSVHLHPAAIQSHSARPRGPSPLSAALSLTPVSLSLDRSSMLQCLSLIPALTLSSYSLQGSFMLLCKIHLVFLWCMGKKPYRGSSSLERRGVLFFLIF